MISLYIHLELKWNFFKVSSPAFLELVEYGQLQLLGLVLDEAELGDVARRMVLRIIVAQLSCNIAVYNSFSKSTLIFRAEWCSAAILLYISQVGFKITVLSLFLSNYQVSRSLAINNKIYLPRQEIIAPG